MLIMLYSCIVWSLQSGSFHQSQAFPKILSLVSGCGASKRGWVWSCRASKQRWNHWLLSTTAQWSCVKQCQLHGRSAECIYSYHPMLWSLWWDVSVGVTHPCCSSISLQKLCRCSISPGALAQLPDAPCLSTVGSFDQFVANKSCSQTLKSFNQLKRVNVNHSGSLWLTWLTWLMWLCIPVYMMQLDNTGLPIFQYISCIKTWSCLNETHHAHPSSQAPQEATSTVLDDTPNSIALRHIFRMEQDGAKQFIHHDALFHHGRKQSPTSFKKKVKDGNLAK